MSALGDLFSLNYWQSWITMIFSLIVISIFIYSMNKKLSRFKNIVLTFFLSLISIFIFGILNSFTKNEKLIQGEIFDWLNIGPKLFFSLTLFFLPLYLISSLMKLFINIKNDKKNINWFYFIVNSLIIIFALFFSLIFSLINQNMFSFENNVIFDIKSKWILIYLGLSLILILISFIILYFSYTIDFHYENVKSFFINFNKLVEVSLDVLFHFIPIAIIDFFAKLIFLNGIISIFNILLVSILMILFVLILFLPIFLYNNFKKQNSYIKKKNKYIFNRIKKSILEHDGDVIISTLFILPAVILIMYLSITNKSSLINLIIMTIIIILNSTLLLTKKMDIDNDTKIILSIFIPGLILGISFESIIIIFALASPASLLILYLDYTINYVEQKNEIEVNKNV